MWKMAKIKSNSIQNIMMLSCMQKKVKLESNSPQKSMWITCTQKKMNTSPTQSRTPACRKRSR